MSADPASSTDTDVVYVQLLGEGTRVFRPAKAELIGPNTARLHAPDDYDPENEEWEFPPGTVIVWELQSLSDGPARVAVARAA